jgi:hypothetical protein
VTFSVGTITCEIFGSSPAAFTRRKRPSFTASSRPLCTRTTYQCRFGSAAAVDGVAADASFCSSTI